MKIDLMTVVDLPSGSINTRRAKRIMNNDVPELEQTVFIVCVFAYFCKRKHIQSTWGKHESQNKNKNKQKSQPVSATSCEDTNVKSVKMHAHM